MASADRAVAARLFDSVMAPLVVGGEVRPGHAISVREATSLLEARLGELDAAQWSRVQAGRVRRARRLVPIDEVGPPTGAELAMAAGLHDLLVAANPLFDTPLRRPLARQILDQAVAVFQAVSAPPHLGDALSRHSWFAGVLDLERKDTSVSWWLGSRKFLGDEPPARVRAWPELRRVRVRTTAHRLLELTPLAVERERLRDAVARLLRLSPLTDLASCTRADPPFAWSDATLALLRVASGRRVALRALSALPAMDVDAALGRATRQLLSHAAAAAQGDVLLPMLAERAIAAALLAPSTPSQALPPVGADAAVARALGAVAAARELGQGKGPWDREQRARLQAALESVARSPAALPATTLLGGLSPAPRQ